MKKIFTLIAMALMAVGANAESWRPAEEAPAAGSAIIKGDLLKVNTVFETTCGKIIAVRQKAVLLVIILKMVVRI